MASIYSQSTGSYGGVKFPLRRGIKEGCLPPSLFVIVYEAFHSTLASGFPNFTVLAYVDDVAVIAHFPRTFLSTHEHFMSAPPKRFSSIFRYLKQLHNCVLHVSFVCLLVPCVSPVLKCDP